MFSRMLSNVCAAVDQSECQQAAKILMDAFPGVDEERLVIAVFGAGLTLHSQGKLEEAEKHYRLVWALYEKCMPEAHAEALSALRQLVIVLDSTNRANEADLLLRDSDSLIKRAIAGSTRKRFASAESA